MRSMELAGAVLILSLVAACGGHDAPTASSAPRAAATVLVNKGSGDTFTHVGAAQLGNVLTASQALADFKAEDPLFRPQGHVAYTLGALAQGRGDQGAVPPGTPVWALTWHQCPQPHGLTPFTPTTPCVHWLFLNAPSGHMIVAEYQDAPRD